MISVINDDLFKVPTMITEEEEGFGGLRLSKGAAALDIDADWGSRGRREACEDDAEGMDVDPTSVELVPILEEVIGVVPWTV